MAGSSQNRKAAQVFRDMAGRTGNPKLAMSAIGRNAVNRHIGYYRGNGPPGDPWPALEESTILSKAARGKTQKLVDTALLKGGYEYKATATNVTISNRETVKVNDLQVDGVGRKHKKFKVVATTPETDDPQLMKDSEEILANFLFTGKAKK